MCDTHLLQCARLRSWLQLQGDEGQSTDFSHPLQHVPSVRDEMAAAICDTSKVALKMKKGQRISKMLSASQNLCGL